MIFEYGKKETDFLKSACPKLKKVIDTYGIIERTVYDDFFTAFAHIIIEQQISVKAAENIFAKLSAVCTPFTPQKFLSLSQDIISDCGVSPRKSRFITSCATSICDKTLMPDALFALSNEEIISRLTQLDGVGVWSAQMLLIFYFCKKDVLAFGDFGIKKGLCTLYNIENLSSETFSYYEKLFSPYATIAGFYLWKINETPVL